MFAKTNETVFAKLEALQVANSDMIYCFERSICLIKQGTRANNLKY